ncbi:MAG: AAA family ATPase [Conexivisphaerales archaeon]
MNVHRLIVCITGMPGAGKTTAHYLLPSLGFTVLSMGDIIREESQRRGYGLSAEGQRRTQQIIRKEKGAAAVAELCAEKILREGLKLVVIDGIRSMDEVNHFRQISTVKTLCIHASPTKRFLFLARRGRKDDPKDLQEFTIRDKAEMELGVSNVIALADRVIDNEELTIDELRQKTLNIVRSWVEKNE